MGSSSKFFYFFSCLIQTYFLCSEFVTGCLVAERRALLQFKNGLHDPETRLSSWRGRECCSWRGVRCDNQTGLVTSIDLPNPYPNTVGFVNSNQSHGFWNLSGEIDSSLLHLNSLEQLDLSYNTFENIPIPSFFGSLKKLRYLNLSNAGFSGTVPPQLGNLTRLQYLDLDLAYYTFPPLQVNDFEWISGLSSLKVLSMYSIDLSMVEFGIFRALNKLSSLKELHMSACGIAGIVQNLPLINLTSLRVVDLSSNYFNTMIPSWFANLSSLVYLDLSNAEFFGPIPILLSRISSLRFINLAKNINLTADIYELLGGNWRHVENIRLSLNKVHGFLPDNMGNLTSLIELDLQDNNIEGRIPSSIGMICNLEILKLDGNNLTFSLPRSLEVQGCLSDKPLQKLQYFSINHNEIEGILPEWLGELRNLAILQLSNNKIIGDIPPSLGNLSILTELNLEGNQLNNTIPLAIGNLYKLRIFDVSYNKIIGSIPSFLGNLSLLTTLSLDENKFNGTIPSILGNLSKLEIFGVSSNQLTGTVKEEHFLKLSGLKILMISSNSLIVKFGSSWFPPFQIWILSMGSCQLGPQFPSWIRNQRELRYVDISNGSISGEIPNWFLDLSSKLALLNISFNKLEGQMPNPIKFSNIVSLDISHNNFYGCIPSNLSLLQYYIYHISLSSNNLSGTIPSSIGDLQELRIIDLSNNHLIGSIPSSLQNCSYLEVLVLEHNNLSGQIPHSFGSLVQLQTLHLNNNALSGLIPQSLQNCTKLETLDLGNNELMGSIPAWLGERLLELHILRLRSNKFTGQIPSKLSNLKSLQVIDLAKNLLFGTIPHSFGALEGMNTPPKLKTYQYGSSLGTYYEESISIEVNNIQLIYTNTLSLVISIDLSENNLSGGFPETLTNLSCLIILDLSQNCLTGKIPQNIHTMKELESLDLSKNIFFGEIPKTITYLTFLRNLNLSNNNFSGMIPEGGQMTTFSSSAFLGNKFLCGEPLVVVCKEDNVNLHNTYNRNNGNDMNWELVDDSFYLAFGLGFTVGLLGLVVVMFIRKSWADSYFDFVDLLVKKMMNVKRTMPMD